MVGACIIIGTGFLYYYNARQIMLLAAGNQLESLSSAKKHRIESIVNKKYEELRLVQSRLFEAEHLYQYNVFGKLNENVGRSYRKLIKQKLQKLTKDIESFKTIHILNKDGIVVASTDSSAANFNFSYFEFVQKALKSNNNIYPLIDYKTDNIYLCLAGPIYYHNKLQGVILIETTTPDLVSLTGDYTGLGNTGETIIGQLISDTLACYITPTRSNTTKFQQIVLNKKNPQPVFLALTGQEKLFLDVMDNHQKKVAASCRFIADTEWGVVTKIDMEEILSPSEELKWMIIRIGVGALVILFIVSLILASRIVKPINEISAVARRVSQGDLAMQLEINSKNEVGDLAQSFNKMTKSLIAAQENLESKIKELDRSNVSLEKFAFVVSHDLKSPLNSVLGIAELLGTENMATLTKDGTYMLQLMRAKINHLKGMIGGILDFARLNQQLPTDELLDLRSVIDRIGESYASNVCINISNELPFLQINTVVAEQLLQNLFNNAIKYNKRDKIEITVGSHLCDGEVIYFVSDNGIGIAEKYFTSIFNIFQTVAPKGNDSNGIGLAIVKKIVEGYGGRIWVNSVLNEGSTFYFTLPSAQPNDSLKNNIKDFMQKT